MAESGGPKSGGRGTSPGLVYSIGLERYVARAKSALAASQPLLRSLDALTKASDRLSDSAGAVKLPGGQLKQASGGLKEVNQHAQGAAVRFGQLTGAASSIIVKLVTLTTLFSGLARAKALLSGEGVKVANALSLGSTALGIFAGKLNPVSGGSRAFVDVMKMLPGKLGTFGSSTLAAGLTLGLLSGGLGPVSAGLGLMKVGMHGIPGQFGKIVTSAGTLIASFGVTTAIITGLASAATAVGVALAIMAPGLTFGVKLAAEAEQANIAFEVMLGSAEAAQELLGQIRGFAIKTPFGEAELIAAGRSLIAFGESANNVVPALQRIGDISSGIGAPIGEIAQLYGKARVQGRLFAVDINQLTNRGIPIIQELAKQFGVVDSEVKALVESGQVNFGHLEQAFISLTAAGGRFHGLTARQSQSLGGLWSTFKDEVNQALRQVGEQFVKTGALQRAMASAGRLVAAVSPAIETFAGWISVVVDAMGDLASVAAGALVIVNSLASLFSGWGGTLQVVIPALALVAAGTLAVVAAQKAWVIAQIAVLALSGPKGWATLAAGAAVAAVSTYAMVTALSAAEKELAANADQAKQTTSALDGIKPVTILQEGEEARLKQAASLSERYRTKLESLRNEWREIDAAFSDQASRRKFGMIAMDNATGVISEIKSVQNEIDVLRGKSSEAEQKLREMMEGGAGPKWISELRALYAEREQLEAKAKKSKEDDQLGEEARRSQAAELKRAADESLATAERWRDKIQTPMERFKSQAKEISENKDLTLDEKGQAMTQLGREMIDSQPQAEAARPNTAVTANTDAAISSIIAATTARSPNQRSEELLEKIQGLASDQKDVLLQLLANGITSAIKEPATVRLF